jgi:hypothetical protein
VFEWVCDGSCDGLCDLNEPRSRVRAQEICVEQLRRFVFMAV